MAPPRTLPPRRRLIPILRTKRLTRTLRVRRKKFRAAFRAYPARANWPSYRPAEGRGASFRVRSMPIPAFDATTCSAAFLFAAWARLLTFFFAFIRLPPIVTLSSIDDSFAQRDAHKQMARLERTRRDEEGSDHTRRDDRSPCAVAIISRGALRPAGSVCETRHG
jgi:hypothetical protein